MTQRCEDFVLFLAFHCRGVKIFFTFHCRGVKMAEEKTGTKCSLILQVGSKSSYL